MRLSFLAFILLFQTIPAQAFRLSPMVVEFAPTGTKATQTFLLENTEKERVAIQLEATTRAMDINGKEQRGETKDFLIFPEQLSLDAGERRNVRVTYVGKQNLEKEFPFRLIASQLPVDFKKSEANKAASVNLHFLLQYVASIYVGPDSAKPKLEVAQLVAAKRAGELELVLKNSGTKHRLLNDIQVILVNKKTKWKLDQEQMKKISSENILPGGVRHFFLKPPADFGKENIKAELNF